MGRAIRWLKKLLTGKKEAKEKDNTGTSGGSIGGGEAREKRRWSFGKQRKSTAGDGGGCKKHLAAAAAAETSSQVTPCICDEELDGRMRVVPPGRGECQAAIVIQKAFRGYLARKALRALKSLVRLQALVRGYLVRKQAATTLQRLQALMRLQASSYAVKKASARKSLERERIVQEARIKQLVPAHCRRLSDSTESNFERSPRIVEMDTCQLRSRSSRMTGRNTLDSSDSLPSLVPVSSPLLCKPSPCLSIRRSHEHEPRYSKTAQNTPRLGSVPGDYGSPVTPAKSVGTVDGLMRRVSYREGSPRYMADTASSVAKMRCQSAPRQRHSTPPASLAESRSSLSRAGSRKSCSQVQDSFSFKSSEVSRISKSEYFGEEPGRDYYLDKMW